jgi:hypothetical protein
MNAATVAVLVAVARLLRYLARKASAAAAELPDAPDFQYSRGHAEGRAATYTLVADWLRGIAEGEIDP